MGSRDAVRAEPTLSSKERLSALYKEIGRIKLRLLTLPPQGAGERGKEKTDATKNGGTATRIDLEAQLEDLLRSLSLLQQGATCNGEIGGENEGALMCSEARAAASIGAGLGSLAADPSGDDEGQASHAADSNVASSVANAADVVIGGSAPLGNTHIDTHDVIHKTHGPKGTRPALTRETSRWCHRHQASLKAGSNTTVNRALSGTASSPRLQRAHSAAGEEGMASSKVHRQTKANEDKWPSTRARSPPAAAHQKLLDGSEFSELLSTLRREVRTMRVESNVLGRRVQRVGERLHVVQTQTLLENKRTEPQQRKAQAELRAMQRSLSSRLSKEDFRQTRHSMSSTEKLPGRNQAKEHVNVSPTLCAALASEIAAQLPRTPRGSLGRGRKLFAPATGNSTGDSETSKVIGKQRLSSCVTSKSLVSESRAWTQGCEARSRAAPSAKSEGLSKSGEGSASPRHPSDVNTNAIISASTKPAANSWTLVDAVTHMLQAVVTEAAKAPTDRDNLDSLSVVRPACGTDEGLSSQLPSATSARDHGRDSESGVLSSNTAATGASESLSAAAVHDSSAISELEEKTAGSETTRISTNSFDWRILSAGGGDPDQDEFNGAGAPVEFRTPERSIRHQSANASPDEMSNTCAVSVVADGGSVRAYVAKVASPPREEHVSRPSWRRTEDADTPRERGDQQEAMAMAPSTSPRSRRRSPPRASRTSESHQAAQERGRKPAPILSGGAGRPRLSPLSRLWGSPSGSRIARPDPGDVAADEALPSPHRGPATAFHRIASQGTSSRERSSEQANAALATESEARKRKRWRYP